MMKLRRPYMIKEQNGELRMSGRSTRIALETILNAWSNPGLQIPIIDHYDSVQSHRTLCKLIMDKLKDLKLKEFQVDIHRKSIVYNGLPTYTVQEILSPNTPFIKEAENEKLLEEYDEKE